MTGSRAFARVVSAVLVVTALAVASPLGSSVDTVDAVQVVSGGFTTSASIDPTGAITGQRVTVTVAVKSDRRTRALVDVEIYDPAGGKVFQQYWDNQLLKPGVQRQFSASWTPPAGSLTGTYSVKVGTFGSGWTLLHWNDQAATLQVTSGVTSTTQPQSTTTSTTTPPPPGRFSTLPVGAALPSGEQCAALVRPAVEIRPENAAANANRGSRANANTRTDWWGFNRVDGAFAGTTDEIIQWVACKWGIDEDVVRAQVIKESYWYQSVIGDNGESWGLGQVRQPFHPSAFQFAVNARTSSAYNLDYTYAVWRGCFEGAYTWLNSTSERNGTYGPGDVWGCVGVWFSGRWYWNNDAYLNQPGDSVRWHYTNRTWTTTTFING
jgi:autotransporter family porin